MEFTLVDPLLVSEKGLKGATVMTIGALYDGGGYLQDDAGTMRQRVNTLNHNLGEMAHRVGARRALQKKTGGKHPWQIKYCSRCGGKFHAVTARLYECERCKLSFQESLIIAEGNPNIPPKVVRYATSHGHKFAKKPPRP